MRADPALAPIPVIVLTSSSAEQRRVRVLRARRQRVRGQAAGAGRVHGPDRAIRDVLARRGAPTLGRAMTGIARRRDRGRARGRGGRLALRAPASAGRGPEAMRLQRAILDSLQDGVVVYDEDERIVFFNPAAQEILGVPREELLQRAADLGAAGRGRLADAGGASARWRSRRARARPCVGVDVGLRRGDGGDALDDGLHARAAGDAGPERPLRGGGGVHRHHRAARGPARRSSAPTRSWPSSPTSPRTTSASRCGWCRRYLQLLRRRYHGQIDEDADEFIDFAVEGANRMRALIEDLLAYSRAGRGAEPRPVDLGW